MNVRIFTRILVVTLLLFILAVSGEAVAGCSSGDKADVLWKGTWYAATVLQANGDQCFIQYDGYDASWNEWVGPDRIRLKGAAQKTLPKKPQSNVSFQEGDAVTVLWKGTWYDAHVLKTKGAQTFIHYDGYESSWDEWVGPERIKAKPGAAAKTAPAPSPSGFNAAGYTCGQFLTDYQAKAPASATALEYAIAYFGKRSGKSMEGMDKNARMGFEMAFNMECPASPQATWEKIVQQVYDSSTDKK